MTWKANMLKRLNWTPAELGIAADSITLDKYSRCLINCRELLRSSSRLNVCCVGMFLFDTKKCSWRGSSNNRSVLVITSLFCPGPPTLLFSSYLVIIHQAAPVKFSSGNHLSDYVPDYAYSRTWEKMMRGIAPFIGTILAQRSLFET